MEYFKKLSVNTPHQTIIDCPVRIQEIAIIQDTVKKDILGRIIFANQSKENIIAVFFDLSTKDISGEPISLNESCFIYQDMIVAPGELYGNKIAINLPDNARFFSATINKIVFENGDVWKASDAQTCPEFTLEQIDIPQENYERIRRDLTKVIPDVDYINYYYQENESAWLCSCGKINPLDSTTCSFCGCEKSSQEAYLTKEHFSSFCYNINSIVEKEKEEATRIVAKEKQRQEEEKARKEKERLEKQAEEERENEIQHKARRDEIIRYCIIGAEAVIASAPWKIISKSLQLQQLISIKYGFVK